MILCSALQNQARECLEMRLESERFVKSMYLAPQEQINLYIDVIRCRCLSLTQLEKTIRNLAACDIFLNDFLKISFRLL
uniref:SJCHGC09709 protein n=1 Tax=Schistosoma japonicum TaxID=6182 RepID=Q5BR30_SCHJA|nr:SJCHGC09709 protein [Schistosoma japonicum]